MTHSAERFRVDGIVQGVGFRPFVHALATGLGLSGFVANDSRGVVIEVEGPKASVTRFRNLLRSDAPPLARIVRVTSEKLVPRGAAGFSIVESRTTGARQAFVAPDVATCGACLAEIFDPSDRRHRYAFTNCTNCGPRFTIVADVPYDRSRTTMAGFAPCLDCAREYRDPSNRRFHAEPVCCPRCGPRLKLVDGSGSERAGDAIVETAKALVAGEVVAIKGLGGYHLAALAANEDAVGRLRARKHREEKPFAVMAPDLDTARTLAVIDPAGEEELCGQRRPIVLLEKRVGAALAPSVAPDNRFVGVLLPYTPLHHLLAREVGRPFVLTSGNVSDEPIAYRDEDALARLAGIADAFLTHDRAIHVRTDDSVVRVVAGVAMPIRRSRGYAPEPLALADPVEWPILACGGELKSTFCLAKEGSAFLSHHIGDLENFSTLASYREGVEHFRRLFDVEPAVVAHDLHPEYLSTKYALELAGVERIAVQHHHAHVAACMADNGERGPVLGVAFDGLGYGADGTLWGGEILVAGLASYERVAHLEVVAMPGGSAAIREPWRMAASWLDAGAISPEGLAVFQRNAARWSTIRSLVTSRTSAPLTSSVGRLFDAIAAILGLRDRVTYEGQAAILLEQIADVSERSAYGARVDGGIIRGSDLVAAVVEDLARGVRRNVIAARFHRGVARAIVATARDLRASRDLGTVALSGGVFQNQLLLEDTVRTLDEEGFRVLVHRRVPPNDGGLAFGQAIVAAATMQHQGGLRP